MGQYVGLDVSLDETKVHVLDDQGKRVWRGVNQRRRHLFCRSVLAEI
jgi:hypothetical protein